MAILIPELPRCSAFELAAAVRRTILDGPPGSAHAGLEGRLPSTHALRDAGATVAASDATDENSRALALLEAPYVVAASDGLEPQERQALSALIAHVVGNAPPEAVCEVLDWFDERLAADGVEARIAHIAGHFESRQEREQVLGFAVLLSLADRRMALAEQSVLIRLGEALEFKQSEVQMLVHKISLRLERAMAVTLQPPPRQAGDDGSTTAIDELLLSSEPPESPDLERFTPPPQTPPAGSHRTVLSQEHRSPRKRDQVDSSDESVEPKSDPAAAPATERSSKV